MDRTKIARFAASAAIAMPVTIALLLLMTHLILPGNDDRVVTRMIRNIELQRRIKPSEPLAIRVYERPRPLEVARMSEPRQSSAINPVAMPQEERPETSDRAKFIDWWAEARKLTEQTDDEALKRWLLEQGFESYVSVMQGELPITNPVELESPLTQENKTGYLNTYGDMEYAISENCVATTQVAARFDHSDFGKALPMRITCKPRKPKRFNFDRDERDRRAE